MKFFGRISILVSAVSVAVVGCGGGGNPPPAVTTPFTVMSNTFDPLLVSAKIDDGTVVEYFGTRDADGLPTSLNAVTLTASGGEQTAFTLDSEGRPVMATAPNGVQMTFDWIEQRKVVIVATTPDGQTQVSTVVDFDAPQQGSPSIFSDGAVGNGVAMRQGQRATLELKPARQSMSPLAPGLRDVAITVKVCDVPDPNPVQVFLTITPGLTKQPITVPAKFVGNGIYSATVPDGAAATVDFGELCETSAVVLGYGCTAIELLGPAAPTLICAGISAAIDLLLGGPTGEGLLIFAACQKITAGLVIYCETIGQSIPGGPSLLDMLCKSEFINRTITGDVTIQAWVNALPSNVQSARVTAPGDGPFPPLSIDLGGSGPHL